MWLCLLPLCSSAPCRLLPAGAGPGGALPHRQCALQPPHPSGERQAAPSAASSLRPPRTSCTCLDTWEICTWQAAPASSSEAMLTFGPGRYRPCVLGRGRTAGPTPQPASRTFPPTNAPAGFCVQLVDRWARPANIKDFFAAFEQSYIKMTALNVVRMRPCAYTGCWPPGCSEQGVPAAQLHSRQGHLQLGVHPGCGPAAVDVWRQSCCVAGK